MAGFRRLDPFGNPNVGVYVRATEKHLFVPLGLTKNNREDLQAAMDLEPIQVTLGGSPLVGSLMAANSNGCLVADLANDDEVAALEGTGLRVARMPGTRLNAAGNNILCNDAGALAHPDLPSAVVEVAADVLGVDVERGTIAGLPTVGSAAVATPRGILAHPLATEAELAFIKKTLHAPARIGTVNHGHGLVGAGMVANTAGAACGSRTTGIELGRIEEALGFLETTT